MRKESIFIGTSGWNYSHWKENFYPENVSQKNWLKFYSEKLNTVEINSSFYHLPKETTFEKWKTTFPKGFVFSVKASRYITHMKKLIDSQESVQLFLSRAKILGDKLGPVLFQLPPSLKFNNNTLEEFLRILPGKFKYTIEFRHQSWWNNETYELLRKNNIAFCIYELGKTISPKEITSDFTYLRLHGPGTKYKGNYNDEILQRWANYFFQWQVKEIYCYFDNDEKGYAPKNAQTLRNFVN